MPPAQQSNPARPADGRKPMYAPLHASMTAPDAETVNDPPPVDPAQYNPPLSGPADGADPAIMELPPIDAWRKAS